MKSKTIKSLFVLTLALLINAMPVISQSKEEMKEIDYRRSSLHTILLETGDFLNKDMVINSYNLAPFPEKYNDHRLVEKSFNPAEYGVVIEEGEDEEKAKKAEKELPAVIEKYFNDNKVANKLVAKWFSRNEQGAFNMSLIHERGSYDASEMEAQIAKGSIRGLATLKDAGEELIKNTFVVCNKMFFLENEPIALGISETAILAASRLPGLARDAAVASAHATYEATKDGYSVWTVSYLYQLEWNDEVANTFYMDMWMDESSIDPAKKEMFDNSDIFKLNYVGYQKAKSLVLIGVGRSESDIIQQATIRNVDKVYTKLQKAYDVFKTKTPIYSVDPVVAKIGMKEGVEGGDKYEVLEQTMDEKTGLTKYVSVGTLKVDDKMIWDNRYNMETEEAKTESADLKGTQFKGGGKKIMAGMLLRQLK